MERHNKGFTLVELLTVIVIIAILSSVIITSLNSSRAKARDAKRVSDIKQFQLALALYQDAYGKYPSDIYGTALTGYMATLPKDPSTGANYKYAYYPADSAPSVPTYYHLGAILETNGSVLLDDKDCNSADTTCPARVIYTAGGFNGADNFKCDGATTGGYCYDVTP